METGPNSLMTVEMHVHVYCAVTDESRVNHRQLASAPHHPQLDDSGGAPARAVSVIWKEDSRCIWNA